LQTLVDRQMAQLRQVQPLAADGLWRRTAHSQLPSLWIQPRTTTGIAVATLHVFFKAFARRRRLGIAVLFQQLRYESFKVAAVLHRLGTAAPGVGDMSLAGAV